MQLWCLSRNRHTSFRHTIRWIVAALLFVAPVWLSPSPARAEPAAHTIGFQGRLLLKDGSPVKDGNYNMQFKIYKGGDGTKAGNPGGELVWTENYLNTGGTGGVPLKNGRFAVQLGSNESMSGVDWSSGGLRLSMNIAGSGDCSSFGTGGCKADGEMLPMKQISASPYAMSAGKLGDKSAGDFVQLGQGKQTDASEGSSIFVDKTGNGNLIQLQHNGNDSFTVSNTGDITLGGGGDRAIALEPRDTGGDLTLKAGSSTGQAADGGNLILSGGDAFGEASTGGNIVLKGGGSKNDVDGLVIIGTPTFQTTISDDNCRPGGSLASSDCQITDKSLNTSAAIIVGFDTEGKSARIPEPAIKTAGRIVYIIGASESKEFGLLYGKSGDKLIMQPDTATSLLWNGTGWVPIGPHAPAPAAPQSDEPKTGGATTTPPGTSAGSTAAEDSADTVEGSMYYDDELGKIRCYQSGTWGDCAAAPDAFITISPEYSGAVMNGTDLGTISSDLCSDVLGINNGSKNQGSVCTKGETYNYYQWSTREQSPQTRSIYVTYKLPNNFKQFVPDTTTLTSRLSSEQANVSYQLYRSRKSEALTACGETTDFAEPPGGWHALKAEKEADPANCDFKPGDSLLIRINLTAEGDASAYVSDIDFVYSSR